ncbi:MAG: four helix bundle protein [Shewanella sp. CG18_big_fil_WC_8_21_14_2_50_42_11]|uniref:four helix bundle protein n=1 Tax=Shewanella sp. CG18_big_fil_WC_8_21_14_2_50_42_11 TaxID=1975538 RepID=UPI000C3BDEC5|nr:four helix bundle protein [Shewanella sp. CG18_big_fil_WC_8_21_14_2_50_42_11]PIQ01475.1 MAG: four helix bundle protein [Shewanella sp. CG18_big_fil_WC_8_21_14_2_50_42_11]
MAQHTRQDTALIRKYIETVKLLNMYLNHFPNHEKYALCNQIRTTAYRIYDLITEGVKRYQKKTTLRNLDIAHQQLRMQLHLAFELGYFKFRDGAKVEKANPQERFMKISALVDELGRMIGAWVKKFEAT